MCKISLETWIQLHQKGYKAYLLDSCSRLSAVQRGVATCLRMRRLNNGQKVDFAEIDAGGGPETGIPLVVALFPRAYAGRTTSLNG